VIRTFFLPSVESGAVEDSITSRGVAVVADRCVAVAEARSVGDLGEKEKRCRKSGSRAEERQEQEPHAHRDGEILWSRPEFLHTKNTVVQLKLWF
jgi:hypothetical protein